MGKRARSIWFVYFTIEKNQSLFGKGPVGKFFEEAIKEIMKISKSSVGDSLFSMW